MGLKSFVEVKQESHFPIENLPYGVFRSGPVSDPRPGVAIGDYVLDLSVIASAGLFNGPILNGSDCFHQPNLNKLLGLGKPAWKEARATLQTLLSSSEPALRDNESLKQKALIPMVEKLKDLCLKQRDEIRSLKSAVLFPDMVNLEIEDMLEKQGSELKQAKQLIPNLQRQVLLSILTVLNDISHFLTGQLQSLAVDLAEVKADKYSSRSHYDSYVGSPKMLTYDNRISTNSLDFSSEDQTTPGSPDDMF